LATRVGINLRGRSTQGFPKSSYAVEIWDDGNQDQVQSVLGLPAESDWVLYAPNMFDTPLIHDAFIYQLSNDLGRYAPRPRMVEVFVNTTGGALQGPAPSGDYRGVYVLTEKIKRNDDRVAIARLEPEHIQAPQVTGGYLLKIDSADANERTLSAAGVAMVYQYPNGLEMVTAQRSAQSNYIRSYFNSFYSALTSPGYTNLTTGYPAYVDIDSWLDHHLLNVLALNADALRLSAYFFKDRETRLEMGPIWDFDRALGTSRGDLRPFDPRTWMASSPLGGGDYGTDFFNPTNTFSNPWYSRMFRDPDFWQRWVDRYQELRTTCFSNVYLSGLVDGFAAQLREAQPREQARWQGSGSSDTSPRSGTVSVTGYAHTFPGTYQGEIDFMKRWLGDRLDFMDTNFLARPMLSLTGGPVSPGTAITLSGPAGATLYYTTDGTDPRLAGGGLSPRARAYNGALTISTNSRVVARARNLSHANLTGPGKPPLSTPWSGVVAATYVIQAPPLVISEIMYHPSPPPPGTAGLDPGLFEYVELLNLGTTSLNLAGFRFTQGIEFVFPSVVVGPGQRIVVAKDVSAFQSRYGTAVAVVGPFLGQLDNAGERLTLKGPLLEPILDFSFDNRWHPITDGHGFSLAVVDTGAALSTWALRESWRPSGALLGSPGQPEPVAPTLPAVWINEALAHTDPPLVDTIEVRNPASVAAEVGGWFLSDDFETPKKFRIPTGTKIPAHGFIVFSDADFNVPGPNGFLLRSTGDQVYLFSGDASANLTGYLHGFEFGASTNAVSLGRYLNSMGDEHFVAQTARSLGAPNLGPRIGPVVVNEIMYHPPPVNGTNNNTRDEYLELYNISDQPVLLFDPAARTNTWHLRGGVSFDFPTNVTLPAGGYLLVASFDPVLRPGDLAAFRAKYGLSPSVPIFGPYEGRLENEGEQVRLLRPDPPQTVPGPDLGQVPYVLVEAIDYVNVIPWPASANATGQSIQRLVSGHYGNDPLNWQGTAPTPGGPNRSGTTDTDGDGLPDWWERAFGFNPASSAGGEGGDGDPDGDGVINRQEYLAGTRPDDAASYLCFDWVEPTAGGVTLQIRAAPGRSYSVLYQTAVGGTNWMKLADVAAPNAFVETVLTDTSGGAARFYRLVSPRQ
jgi:hypothetical protein